MFQFIILYFFHLQCRLHRSHAAEAASSIDLADIVIDDDSAELDKFLEATEIDSAPSETGH